MPTIYRLPEADGFSGPAISIAIFSNVKLEMVDCFSEELDCL